MAKITIVDEICNAGGTIYYAGFVNGVYTHFLSYDKLKKSEIKSKLLDKYNKTGYLGGDYGRD